MTDVEAAGPVLPQERLHNFRDFGGRPGAEGRRVVRGRLFRSGHHARATEADLAALRELDLRLVVDLRRAVERRERPSRRPDPFEAMVIEHAGPEDVQELAPHLAHLAAPDVDEAKIRERVRTTYGGYSADETYVEVWRRYFPALAAADGPILIHCHAGKDRTEIGRAHV